MSGAPTSIRFAQGVGILLATTSAGGNAALSFFVIPRLLESPMPLMVRQWANMFYVTSRVFPAPMLLSGCVHLFLAWKLPEKLRVYATAAVLTLSITPFTRAILGPINRKLKAKAEQARNLGVGAQLAEDQDGLQETAHALVDNWGMLNLYRSTVTLMSGCLGLYAAFT